MSARNQWLNDTEQNRHDDVCALSSLILCQTLENPLAFTFFGMYIYSVEFIMRWQSRE
jgi:hypothetical protein